MRTLASLLSVLAVTSVSALSYAQPESDWFEDEEETSQESSDSDEAEAVDETDDTEQEAAQEPETKTEAKPKVTQEGPRKLVIELPPRTTKKADPTAYRHDGFYLRASIGGAAIGMESHVQPFDGSAPYQYSLRDSGVAFDLMMGGTPGDGLVLGGGLLIEAATKPKYSSEQIAPPKDEAFVWGMIGPFVDWYPNAKRGFHLGGLLGAAHASATEETQGGVDAEDAEPRMEASGFGGSLWVGYDAWIAKQWSLGVMLRASSARMRTRTPLVEGRDEEDLEVGSVALLLTGLFH